MPRARRVHVQEQNDWPCQCCQQGQQDEGREPITQKASLTSVKITQCPGGAKAQGRSPRAVKKRRQREHSHPGPAAERQAGKGHCAKKGVGWDGARHVVLVCFKIEKLLFMLMEYNGQCRRGTRCHLGQCPRMAEKGWGTCTRGRRQPGVGGRRVGS